ncbi:hypothetical protein C1645_838859 [Glomus cerebriforme]|uniref:Tesmin/TSO1-like CXC domain-containing protein n=1 Tax=Glomus cerebriforme TaxID=658196 RepID=A0A397SC98_9GLOM|nr:hypothetical protein C1645_838859 [Glomus cerebriforme]
MSIDENKSTLPLQNYHSILIDPVLVDITKTTTTTTTVSRNEVIITGHEILRETALGDLVRIAIPKIDRFGIDLPTLSCKIIGATENNKYLLESKFGIINICYSPGEIEPLGTMNFPALNNLPSDKISEAAQLQSTGPFSGTICNCKSNCSSNKCHCKKVGGKCRSRCHSEHSWKIRFFFYI